MSNHLSNNLGFEIDFINAFITVIQYIPYNDYQYDIQYELQLNLK